MQEQCKLCEGWLLNATPCAASAVPLRIPLRLKGTKVPFEGMVEVSTWKRQICRAVRHVAHVALEQPSAMCVCLPLVQIKQLAFTLAQVSVVLFHAAHVQATFILHLRLQLAHDNPRGRLRLASVPVLYAGPFPPPLLASYVGSWSWRVASHWPASPQPPTSVC